MNHHGVFARLLDAHGALEMRGYQLFVAPKIRMIRASRACLNFCV